VIRLGTRGSALARTQSEDVAGKLEALGHEVEIHEIRTAGDRDQRSRFADVGTAGIFVREIETALLEERVDIAVHSYKDLPSESPADLVVAAIPERLDPADCLIARPEVMDSTRPPIHLRPGSRVATGSARRRALLEQLCPDIDLLPLRGNVPTRLAKLREGPADAIVLAAAGLARLERNPESRATVARGEFVETRLDPRVFVPAPGQGAIAVQCRASDSAVRETLASIHDERAALPLRAERRLLARVQGDCDLPFGAWCEVLEPGGLLLHAVMWVDDSLAIVHEEGDEAESLADRAWTRLAERTRTAS
jgi:hydroxymethylbilane synthase